MNIAIVHDWLVTYAGAERVLERLIKLFPDADIFSMVNFIPAKDSKFLQGKTVYTSFLQKMPLARKKYRAYLPLMPIAVEQFDLSKYDLIISSCHAVSKGVIVGPDQTHICLCYSPMRYAWDLQHQYLFESGLKTGIKSWVARWMLHKLRIWDVRSAAGVDEFIAISHYISRRILKSYRRESTVIYPPVDVGSFCPGKIKEDFYFTASRMVPYKKMPLIVEAFAAMPDKRLIVIGEGPEFDKCKSIATTNVQLLGWQPFEVLLDHLQKAKAFVFAAEEDFGIAPLEAQAVGTPVIAFAKGAALETVRGLDDSKPSGIFFAEQTVSSIIHAVEVFELNRLLITKENCRENAERFSAEIFDKQISEFINQVLKNNHDAMNL